MKIVAWAVPSFLLEIPKETLEVLLALSRLHYDSVCQSAAKVGGFLYGWKNGMDFYLANTSDEPFVARADSHQLQTIMKICEMGCHLPEKEDRRRIVELAHVCRLVFRGAEREFAIVRYTAEVNMDPDNKGTPL